MHIINTLNSIIAYNSPSTRKDLKEFLNGVPNTKTLAETDSGIELIKLVKVLHPNVIFIDTEIFDINGIETARTIRSFDLKVTIIFIAPCEDYLKEAFELYAYDYILKPLDYNRILQSINRILYTEKNEISDFNLKNKMKLPRTNSRLLIDSDGKSNIVNVQEIIFVTRYDRKIVIYFRHGKISFWNSFIEIKKILTDNFFFSHKGYIINVDFIKDIIPYGKKTYQVEFYGSSETALMTAENAKLFREKYCLKL